MRKELEVHLRNENACFFSLCRLFPLTLRFEGFLRIGTLRLALKKQLLLQWPSPAAIASTSPGTGRGEAKPLPVPGDDCMDAGGRAMPGAIAGGRVRALLSLQNLVPRDFLRSSYVRLVLRRLRTSDLISAYLGKR
jgi:hypothetical protein